jgi:hypothetical protein
MNSQTIYLATIWIIPVLVAITFHEAAHGLPLTFWATTRRGDKGGSASIR